MWWVATVARAPPARKASAHLPTRVAGSSQWNAVAASTVSNGCAGSGQSSNAATSTWTEANRASLRRATAAMLAPSSTHTIAQPRSASATVACPVPQPISSTRHLGPMHARAARSSNNAGGYSGLARSYRSASSLNVCRSRARSGTHLESGFAADDRIAQHTQLVDLDLDHVTRLEREGTIGHQGRASAQNHAIWERVLAKETLDQLRQASLDLTRAGLTIPARAVCPRDAHADAQRVRIRHGPGRRHARAERAAARVHFGLRQVQRVIAFDAARAHVVGDCVADDLSSRIDDQRQLRFGYIPARISSDDDRFLGASDASGGAFEEQLGSLGGVHPGVHVRRAALFDTRLLGALVGHTGRPDLSLAVDGSQKRVARCSTGLGPRHRLDARAELVGRQTKKIRERCVGCLQ